MSRGKRERSHAKEVDIRGVYYPSMTAAAKAHGVSLAVVARAREEGRLDYVGTRRVKKKEIDVFGKKYSSLQQAARDLRISFSSLQRWAAVGIIELKLTERANRKQPPQPDYAPDHAEGWRERNDGRQAQLE